ncbi:MAG: RagB/SusD family nutrient uptake outer membrane protein [Bacteroidales bacterium]|nr:RagB/SusD family nutrient uptake outer membrane protein [Bacteroidales bacterium]
MKKIILSAICALSATVMATSCLDLSPKAQLSDAQVWTSAENFELFTNQFYSWTRDFTGSTSVTYMNGYSDGPHADTRSDLLCENSVNTYSSGSNSILSTDANYNNLYKRIYYTNLLLDRASSYSDYNSITEYVAEAYFFRAYLHFELVQLYGDCILLQKALDLDSEELYGPRNDRLEVIKACIDDLYKAADLLGETPGEDGRICKYTAYAFLSRVALYEGTWQKYHNSNNSEANELLQEAIDAAKVVMDSGNYELFYSSILGGRDSYRYMFVLENTACNPAGLQKSANKEYIFYRRHDEALKPIGNNITHGALNNAYYPTRKLADMYRCQDGLPIDVSPLYMGTAEANSDFTNRDNRMNGTLMMHNQIYWNNDGAWRTTWTDADEDNSLICSRCINSGYANYKWCTEREVQDYNEGYDYPIIRYAEILLNYAEAVYELNGSITDAQLDESLNLVRARSNPDMTPLSNSLVSTYGLDMRQEIRDERTVELFFEGFRIDDLKRWKTAETEMPGDLLGIQYTGTYYETAWPNQGHALNDDGCIIMYTNRVWNQKNYLLPLPSDELQLNPELGQNPGWE